jgi:hypothetical protein
VDLGINKNKEQEIGKENPKGEEAKSEKESHTG